MEQIRRIMRPTDVPDTGMLFKIKKNLLIIFFLLFSFKVYYAICYGM
jgi:hypothetical protein